MLRCCARWAPVLTYAKCPGRLVEDLPVLVFITALVALLEHPGKIFTSRTVPTRLCYLLS